MQSRNPPNCRPSTRTLYIVLWFSFTYYIWADESSKL